MKQGSILFSIFLSMAFSDTFTDSTQGLWIQIRLGENQFNFKSAQKTRNILVLKIIFADDTDFMARTYKDE